MSDRRYPRPPAHIEPYVRILGPEKALEFLLAFGGATYSFRENPRKDTPVVQMIGRDAVAALSQELLPARIPLAKSWMAQMLRLKGLPVSAIARKLHASDVAVRRWLKQDPASAQASAPDPRQLRMF